MMKMLLLAAVPMLASAVPQQAGCDVCSQDKKEVRKWRPPGRQDAR